jgi:hypothetical protein
MAQVVEPLHGSELNPSTPKRIKKRIWEGNLFPIHFFTARHQWFTPIILTTQEAEIRKIKVQSQPGQIIQETLS